MTLTKVPKMNTTEAEGNITEQDYLDRCKPRTVGELFDVMQEYCKSDHGRRRRIEAMNQEKKARTNQWLQSKPWHADQLKQ
ncbi:hypothetical protein C2845_PM06G26730 [Panicum miliaceum]|uniref:Uncharacterized protein n=1 Tax=Panicum miliaceum TaxID=4540 RepID=A0A3L6R944_PANMI|nr:hypothetical protein C2845_PM06G26730 [Panicum miliaceum]